MGKTGRGTWEHHGVGSRVDIITTTFGKALGGALGGSTAGSREVIGMLRQRSRPYLFSNSLAPAVVGATLRALELLTSSTELGDRLEANTKAFRERMTAAGFEIKPGVHPIVPIMFSRFAPEDAPLAQRFARALALVEEQAALFETHKDYLARIWDEKSSQAAKTDHKSKIEGPAGA